MFGQVLEQFYSIPSSSSSSASTVSEYAANSNQRIEESETIRLGHLNEPINQNLVNTANSVSNIEFSVDSAPSINSVISNSPYPPFKRSILYEHLLKELSPPSSATVSNTLEAANKEFLNRYFLF